ncbi:hypothetical protein AMK16_12065 [Streptomyces sp. CB00455]|uniref:hypothetical protein n=1 Tax=Streptomyces sp. CB00455 TaxID=1703927 RepID=UPI000939036A|nr:hypothetical protein [Streptomyces sp. CB00455]OKK21092.1 hypothetical protein AMK16_12065 [Streptomyces sp. CB00455]
MRIRRENIDLPEDQGCLRWVLGVPLALLYGPAAYLCYTALAARPGPRDHPWREDVQAVAYLSVGLCLLGLLISVTPVFLRTMGRWWYVLPLLLAAVAFVRAKTV